MRRADGVFGCLRWQEGGTRVRLEADLPELDAILRRLTDYGLRDLTSQPPTLEELFLRHYQTDEPAELDHPVVTS